MGLTGMLLAQIGSSGIRYTIKNFKVPKKDICGVLLKRQKLHRRVIQGIFNSSPDGSDFCKYALYKDHISFKIYKHTVYRKEQKEEQKRVPPRFVKGKTFNVQTKKKAMKTILYNNYLSRLASWSVGNNPSCRQARSLRRTGQGWNRTGESTIALTLLGSCMSERSMPPISWLYT